MLVVQRSTVAARASWRGCCRPCCGLKTGPGHAFQQIMQRELHFYAAAVSMALLRGRLKEQKQSCNRSGRPNCAPGSALGTAAGKKERKKRKKE